MDYFYHLMIFLLARYVHILCATVLVGGTLFYEMIVPPAIDELKVEQQLLIFARARWLFKWVVWLSAALIVLSGFVSTYAHWREYNRDRVYEIQVANQPTEPMELAPMARPGWWWAAHASCGLLAVVISLSLTIGKVPPSQPIRWMRLNLVILMLVMFLATVTRQTRLEAQSPNPPAKTLEPLEIGR
jgi:hypothetical protein